MPLLLPKVRGVRRESNFTGVPSATWGTSVSSHSVAHQYPSTYTELIAATSFDTYWANIIFHTNSATGTDTDSLVTIYVGAGSAEQVLIPNLLAGWASAPGATVPLLRQYGFPLSIPAGSRLSARHQSVRTSTGVRCMVELLGGGAPPHWTGTRVESVGADTSASCGTFVTPGTASDGTLTSLGTNTYEWGFVQPMLGGNTDTTQNNNLYTADLGSGDSTAIDGLDEFLFSSTTAETSLNHSGGRFCIVPAGTTLYLRSQIVGTAEAVDFVTYGVL